jgi:hypothetical protein
MHKNGGDDDTNGSQSVGENVKENTSHDLGVFHVEGVRVAVMLTGIVGMSVMVVQKDF